MSVFIARAAGPENFNDDEKTEYAYQTTDGGLLRVLVTPKGEDGWYVAKEFSPSAWQVINGRRFTRSTENLGGTGGKLDRKPGKVTVL